MASNVSVAALHGELQGTAAFASLEIWTLSALHGEAAPGATGGDGDLGYEFAVNGNTFKQTGSGNAGNIDQELSRRGA